MATILDGKALAAKCKEAVKKEAESLQRKPGLAVIIRGKQSRQPRLCQQQTEGLRRLRFPERRVRHAGRDDAGGTHYTH